VRIVSLRSYGKICGCIDVETTLGLGTGTGVAGTTVVVACVVVAEEFAEATGEMGTCMFGITILRIRGVAEITEVVEVVVEVEAEETVEAAGTTSTEAVGRGATLVIKIGVSTVFFTVVATAVSPADGSTSVILDTTGTPKRSVKSTGGGIPNSLSLLIVVVYSLPVLIATVLTELVFAVVLVTVFASC
jgi:hypothetical protein